MRMSNSKKKTGRRIVPTTMDTSEHTEMALKGVYLDAHPRSLLLSLHKMKKSEVMTDVTLMLPDQSAIPCHKIVLMAASPYFETMFQSGLKECTEQDVKVDFADADTIRTLVEFFYTGVIDVTDDNVKQLTAASEFLCCEDLKVHLEEYLNDNVGSSNCIELYRFSKLYNLSMLLVTAFKFILIHFKEFASMSDFETLTEDELLEIVSNDGLNVENEDIVFDAVVHWVNADPELRKEAFSRIAPIIRFPFCTTTMLTEDICRNRMMLSSGCIEFALEALSSPYHCNSHHTIHNARCVPRNAFKGKKPRLLRMFELCSTKTTGPTSAEEICCSITTRESGQGELKWESFGENLKSRLEKIAVCSTGIYWSDYYHDWNFLDVKTKIANPTIWNPANVDSTIVIIDGKIIAFGGHKLCNDYEITPLKYVESINPEEENPEWKLEPEMLHALLQPYVVRFANKVYVFGEKKTQEFDLVRRKWRMRSKMPGFCTDGGAVALNDKIFVLGGEERVCYSYEPAKDVWKVLSQPTKFYYSFTTAAVWNGKILLGNENHVEEYDPTEDTWSLQNQLLPEDLDIYDLILHTVYF